MSEREKRTTGRTSVHPIVIRDDNRTYVIEGRAWVYKAPCDFYKGFPSRWMLGPCPQCGNPTSNYGGTYSCHNRFCCKSANNFAVSPGNVPEWWNSNVNIQRDGDSWMASFDDFVNLQESVAGFGATPDEAVKDLVSVCG